MLCSIKPERSVRLVGSRDSYPFGIPSIHTLDTLSELEFNKMMAEGLAQAKTNQGIDLDDAFNRLETQLISYIHSK